MKAQTYEGGPGYLFIGIGIVLAFISAMVPHFHTGYHLSGSVLLVGLLPWLVYGITVPLMHNFATLVTGLLMVIIHAWLVFSERFGDGAVYADDTIYRIPIILSVLLLPLAFAGYQCERRRMMTPVKPPVSDDDSAEDK